MRVLSNESRPPLAPTYAGGLRESGCSRTTGSGGTPVLPMDISLAEFEEQLRSTDPFLSLSACGPRSS